jgi:hypothetical protein
MRSEPMGFTTIVLATIVVLTAGGCSGSTAKPRPSRPAKLTVAELDPDSAITVDGGRVSVRSPLGWRRGARSDDYVVRYTPTAQNSYPAIVVTAEPAPDGFAEVTAEKHDDFVNAIAAGLAEQYSARGTSTLLAKAVPLTVGPHRGVAWSAPGTAKVDGLKQPIERGCVALVFAGRLYTVEARAPKGKLDDKGRAAARGVAAGIGPPAPAEPAPPEPVPTEPAAADAVNTGSSSLPRRRGSGRGPGSPRPSPRSRFARARSGRAPA